MDNDGEKDMLNVSKMLSNEKICKSNNWLVIIYCNLFGITFVSLALQDTIILVCLTNFIKI